MLEGLGCVVGMTLVAAVAEALGRTVGALRGVVTATGALGFVVGMTLGVELGLAANLEEIDPQFDIARNTTPQRAAAKIPARRTPPISHAMVDRREPSLGLGETAGAGVPTAWGKGFPHVIQKRSAGPTFWPHFGQLVTLRGETGGGTGGDPGTGWAFGVWAGNEAPNIVPISHMIAPSTIQATLTAGLAPPNKLKIRNCIPVAGRTSAAPPITTSTPPHCWSFFFMT
jgi:hypothetical protein